MHCRSLLIVVGGFAHKVGSYIPVLNLESAIAGTQPPRKICHTRQQSLYLYGLTIHSFAAIGDGCCISFLAAAYRRLRIGDVQSPRPPSARYVAIRVTGSLQSVKPVASAKERT